MAGLALAEAVTVGLTGLDLVLSTLGVVLVDVGDVGDLEVSIWVLLLDGALQLAADTAGGDAPAVWLVLLTVGLLDGLWLREGSGEDSGGQEASGDDGGGELHVEDWSVFLVLM